VAERDELFEGLEQFLQSLWTLAEREGLSYLADRDLSLTQVRTLLMLTMADTALPVNQIADRLDLSAPAACRNIHRLVRLGLLERRESREDRRVRLVSITAKGRDMVDRHQEPRRAALRTFISRLPDDEVGAFNTVLHRLLASDDLLAPSGAPQPVAH
jgi:DNA-binding MarR family transcriptional regulator